MHKLPISKEKLTLALLLIIIGTLGRILLKNLPNIETVTVATILAGALLGGWYTVIVPLTIIALTDMYIGNDLILLFTWSAWALIGFFGLMIRKQREYHWRFSLKLTGTGILASFFFYLYTNFGVWLLWNMYPHTFSGLIQCYIMGLPFLRNSIASDLIFIPPTSLILFSFLRWQKRNFFIEKNRVAKLKRKEI